MKFTFDEDIKVMELANVGYYVFSYKLAKIYMRHLYHFNGDINDNIKNRLIKELQIVDEDKEPIKVDYVTQTTMIFFKDSLRAKRFIDGLNNEPAVIEYLDEEYTKIKNMDSFNRRTWVSMIEYLEINLSVEQKEVLYKLLLK
jgi:hypothetical protein